MCRTAERIGTLIEVISSTEIKEILCRPYNYSVHGCIEIFRTVYSVFFGTQIEENIIALAVHTIQVVHPNRGVLYCTNGDAVVHKN